MCKWCSFLVSVRVRYTAYGVQARRVGPVPVGDFQGKMAFGALRPVSVSAARQRLEAGAAKKRLKAGAARLVLADLG